jgi:hypothetical protein
MEGRLKGLVSDPALITTARGWQGVPARVVPKGMREAMSSVKHGTVTLWALVMSLQACSAGDGDESIATRLDAQRAGPIVQLLIFDDQAATWILDNNNGIWDGHPTDRVGTNTFGGLGDIALAGWGRGTCGHSSNGIAVWRPSTREFFLDDNNDNPGDDVWNGEPTDELFENFLAPAAGFTDQPIIWVREIEGGFTSPLCRGVVGYFRTPNAGGAGHWYLDLNNNGVWDGTPTDGLYQWGVTGDIAVPLGGGVGVGSRLTVFKPSTGQWLKDDGDRAWEGCGTDSCTFFGSPNTKPFGHPNRTQRGVSDGSWRHIDWNANGIWDAGDTSWFYGVSWAQALLW